MRISNFFAAIVLALSCGCSSEHYTQGRGDVGQFSLRHAIAYGGRPVSTNGLPSVGGDWRYVQDKWGIAVLLPISQYSAVDAYIRSAFGPPSNSAGWAASDVGVAIYLNRVDTNTEVGIFPPMSYEQMTEMWQKIDEMVTKNSR
jgi:hypothetical protein